MDWTAIGIATAILGILGLACGLLLAVVAKKFGVAENPQVAAVSAALPQANCGGCGYAGCADYARAIVEEGAPPNRCAPGGPETAKRIGELLGQVVETGEPKMALVRCCGDAAHAKRRYAYNGILDCGAAQALVGGDKACVHGCLGYGSCVRACPVNAIRIANGVATVDRELCIGCGACAKVCPRNVIALVPKSHVYHVLCNSPAKGPQVKKVCATGCIGCRICAKTDETGAFAVNGFLAAVDYTKPPAVNPQLPEKCPGHCIHRV